MADYIDRDTARLMATMALKVGREDPNITADMVRVCVDFWPAADVKPIVRGYYVGKDDGSSAYTEWICSECGCQYENWPEKPTYNFCPCCGADMRETNETTL